MSDAALRMDRIYAWQTGFYDATRRYYLIGRDLLIEALAPPSGGRVLEIGCGTGRNLVKASRRWPDARFCGLDISKVMLAKAEAAVAGNALADRVTLAQADATRFDSAALFGAETFQRIFFSYTLSMIPEWITALDRAAASLPPGGALLIADFGDQSGLPGWFRAVLRAWLALFHVAPRDEFASVLRSIARRRGLECDYVSLYRGYAFIAALRRGAERRP